LSWVDDYVAAAGDVRLIIIVSNIIITSIVVTTATLTKQILDVPTNETI
jgi:hypothetical protein